MAAHLVVLLALIGAALVRGVIIQINRVSTATVVASIQTSSLISSVHTEVAQQLQHIEEGSHGQQHPCCTTP